MWQDDEMVLTNVTRDEMILTNVTRWWNGSN
jgi:hypothetical protein